ncbi:UPF0764 protein C16orf89 homolog isoform X2 [Engystomops pustulosus]|uniref:UPF0764 protein C16orf89 homolog isoform X2 n=1 Tax=Engystomops pustulosus TaxID=76066 RepID=UPI003AFB7B8F
MRLLLLLVSLGLFTPSTTNTETAVRSALSAIEKAVRLLQNQYKDFNLDGLFGFHVLSDEIKGTLERLDPKKDLYGFIQLKRLNNALNEILNKTSYSVQQREPKYYEDFQGILENGIWIPPSSWKQISPGLVYNELRPSCFIEKFSDKCITTLLGNGNENKEPCVVTAPCLKKMTEEGCTDYSLSHQLLFFLVGKLKGCRNDLFVKDIDYYENLFCANIMKSNLDIERDGYPWTKQDLFMENLALCGLCGFSDFYKPEWLNQIISWQDPVTGCYGGIGNNADSENVAKKNHAPKKVKRNDLFFLGNNVNSENAANKNHSPKRVKRRNRVFLGTCHSHMTAVAVGALGGFLYSSTFM